MRNAELPGKGRATRRLPIHSAFRIPHPAFLSHAPRPDRLPHLSQSRQPRQAPRPRRARSRRHRRRAGTLARSRARPHGGGGVGASERGRGLPHPGAPLGPRRGSALRHALHEGLAIGYVGRLVPEKGLDTLLQALAENRGGRWHLWVVGDGPDRERLERIASELRLAARIRWTGALPPDEMTRMWAELDVLVVPSRELPGWAEQSAHPVAEAMAHEVAVNGTGPGATPEVIGDAGAIVPPGDPAALAGALRRPTAP